MKTKEEIIEEAMEDFINHLAISEDSTKEYSKIKEEISTEKAKELPQPVQSPSEWFVEVDGEYRGCFCGWSTDTKEILGWRFDVEKQKGRLTRFQIHWDKDHHIRLLTKEGGCVMDNKVE